MQHPEPNTPLSPALATPRLGQGHLLVKMQKNICSRYTTEPSELNPQHRNELCSYSTAILIEVIADCLNEQILFLRERKKNIFV